jgi:hypothetical protein
MSLTSFIQMQDVVAKLKPFRPKAARKIPGELKAQPRSNRHMLVGTAFDYLLRFELQRRAPHAVAERWVAELAPDRIWRADETGGFCARLRKDDDGVIYAVTGRSDSSPDEEAKLAKEVAGQFRGIVEKARSAHAAYLSNKSPTPADRANLAAHAIRLAKLDNVFRAIQLDPSPEEAAPEDVEDLLGILEIVPFESLLHDKVLLLNPTFGEASRLVGGADCDLISGDMLVDLKTTKGDTMQAPALDQLLGYFLLAREYRREQPTFSEIKRVALYFCRHGCLWPLETSAWTERPDFLDVERWFLERAKKANPAAKVLV